VATPLGVDIKTVSKWVARIRAAGEPVGPSTGLRGGWEGAYWSDALTAGERADGSGVEFQAAHRAGRSLWIEASAKIVERRDPRVGAP
jgi:hypothetical protein